VSLNNRNIRLLIEIAASALVSTAAVYTARLGYYSHRALCLSLAAFAVAAVFLPWLRMRILGPTVLLVSTIMLLAGGNAVVYGGGVTWLPVQQLGSSSLI
jgi:pyruvate carboxylase